MLVADGYLLIGVVELDGETGRQERFGGRSGAAILTDYIGRESWLSPFRDDQDFAVYNVRDEGIVQGDGVAVFGGRGGRVWVSESVNRFGLISMLTEVDCPKMLWARVVWFEEESWGWVSSLFKDVVQVGCAYADRLTWEILAEHIANTNRRVDNLLDQPRGIILADSDKREVIKTRSWRSEEGSSSTPPRDLLLKIVGSHIITPRTSSQGEILPIIFSICLSLRQLDIFLFCSLAFFL